MINSLIRFTTNTLLTGVGIIALTHPYAAALAGTDDITDNQHVAGLSNQAKQIALTPIKGSVSFEQGFILTDEPVTIAVNEMDGLTIKQNGHVIANQNGSFISAGAYSMPIGRTQANAGYIQIAVFDINSQEIRSFSIRREDGSTENVSITETSVTQVKGNEAICSGVVDGQIHVVSIDSLGMLNHYMAMPRDEAGTLRVHSLRTFAIGPGIKSCALTSNFDAEHSEQTLYLADEYAGVWSMSANPEAEIKRDLIFSQTDTPVEGISSAGSLTAWVSPSKSGMWLQTECNTDYIRFDITIAPEMIRISAIDDVLNITVYDDDSGNMFTGQYTLKNNCSPQPIAPPIIKTPMKAIGNAPPSIKTPMNIGINETPINKVNIITPTFETDIVNRYGDAADDPAIWVNQLNPSESLVIGTNKKGSLNTYNLQGKLVARHNVGRVNNVGLAYNWGDQNIDIAVASNRTNNSLSIFSIDKQSGEFTFQTNISTPLPDIYGLCVFSIDNRAEVLVNSTDGRYLHYRLLQTKVTNSQSLITAALLHDFTLPSQPEGCVVDNETQTAFLGEEGAGIWALDVSSPKNTPSRVIDLERPVVGDIEGLALFDVDGERYLIASSQGNNQYAVFQSGAPYRLVGMVKVGPNYEAGIDGVSETDGLEATNVNLTGPFSRGLFVVQDGRNVMPSERQNFKLISGTALENAIRDHVAAKNL